MLQHLQMQVLDLFDDLAVAAASLADDPAERSRQPRLTLLGAKLTQQVAGNTLARGRAWRYLGGYSRQSRGVAAQQYAEQHVVLRREVPVERRDRHACALGQVL